MGTTVLVPVIRHDMSASMWMGIAKIISIGWKQEQVFPVQLAKPFMQQCLFGNVAQKCDLVAPFIQHLPRMDQTVLSEALNDFKADDDELLDLFERLKVKQIATKDNIRRILEEVAHRELVQAPMFVCDSWYNILCQLSINYEQLDHMYENLEPTNRKVLKALTFPDQLSKPEMELWDYVNGFVRELELEMLKLFLRFCTESNMMVKDKIYVRFTATELGDNVRSPTSHRCGCVLEIHLLTQKIRTLNSNPISKVSYRADTLRWMWFDSVNIMHKSRTFDEK